jgi:hypothetical protein
MTLKIVQLPDKTIEIYDLHEEGGAQVRCLPDGSIELWEIPQYGGMPRFTDNCISIQEALEIGSSWT